MDNNIFDTFRNRYDNREVTEMSLQEYLELCKDDPMAYATSAERMLKAIGEPEVIDTEKDPRLSRIFYNAKIKRWDAFSEFYGMEKAIEEIVSFFKHADQGLEESKQVLYLLGPVGSAKSSLAERLKSLAEKFPFYALAVQGEDGLEYSPVLESPLGLFDEDEDADLMLDQFGIERRYIETICSPWATKRLKAFGGDITQFRVVKVWPSKLDQRGITKTEPGDENNQDISSLVGKVNIRMLEDFDQNDPDAYSFSGGLNRTTQGLLEFVEMFKAPIKMLHPLLTATQEGNYNGTEEISAIPFQGVVLAHSNESEWEKFRNNKDNEAFIDRVYIVKVPYCLRVTEEEMIYEKLLANSKLKDQPIAPGTLEMLARFSILSRLAVPENSTLFSKMEIYDGKSLKDKDPKAKSVTEYRELAGVNEGMTGSSTRFAFKVLSKTFNYDADEVAASPVQLMLVLQRSIEGLNLPESDEEALIGHIKGILAPKYAEFLGEEIQKAYLESYSEYGQNIFERYIAYADHFIQDKDYREEDTGTMFNKAELNEELEKIEKPAGISNPKDFRSEAVNFVLREKANNEGKTPSWTSYEKLRAVIEKKMFANTEDLLPVISFGKKASQDEEDKHKDFVSRMMAKGYTEKQVRLLVEWHMRYQKHN